MAELSTLLSTKIYPLKRRIHDCVDTGSTLALSSGVDVLFPCDCSQRDYASDTDSEATTYGFKVTITPNGNMDLKARSVLITA